MAEQIRGMGRGLSAILSPMTQSTEHKEGTSLREIDVSLIVPNPNQPRKQFEDTALVSLAESLRERGVLQPVLVRQLASGKYELIAGERRWRAAQLAGLRKIPVLIGEHDDAESLEIALIENMAREDLNPIEEAGACSLLVEEFGLTREEVGRRVGRSRVSVSNLLRLLELPDEVLKALESGELSEGHGRALLLASDHGERRRLARQVVTRSLSVRQTEAKARAVGKDSDKTKKLESGQDVRGNGRRASMKGGDWFYADHLDAAKQLAEKLSTALGSEVSVTPKGSGFKLVMTLPSFSQAVELVECVEVGKKTRRT